MNSIRTIAVVINQEARQAESVAEEIATTLAQRPVISTFHKTVPGAQLETAIRDAIATQPDTLIVAGGDGSVRTAATLLAGTDMALGVIPAGTTNNTARSLHIPLGCAEAIDFLFSHSPRPVTLGKVSDQYFINVTSIGVSTEIARDTPSAEKKVLGRAAYALTGAQKMFSHEPFSCTLTTPTTAYTLETHQLIIANGSHHAGLKVAPTADITEPHLTVVALGINRSRWQHLKTVALFAQGRHHQSHDALVFPTTHLTVTADPEQSIEADGELLGVTPTSCAVEPHSLRVHTQEEKKTANNSLSAYRGQRSP